MNRSDDDRCEPKRALRSRLRARLVDVDHDAARTAGARVAPMIAEELATRFGDLRGSTVAVFASLPGEIATAPLVVTLRAAGVRIAWPRVADASRLSLHLADEADLRPGTLGILEPASGAPPVAPATLAAVVAPGLAFDARGRRLGHGRGYYDGLFASCPSALRVAVGLSFQLVDEVPVEAHDEPVDVVVIAPPADSSDANPRVRLIHTGARSCAPSARYGSSAASEPRATAPPMVPERNDR